MATFLKHTACPRCGSRDNLAVYDDGSAFCFGCRYTERPNRPSFVVDRPLKPVSTMPDDVVQEYPQHVLSWLAKYDITLQELLERKVYYSPSKDQLIFTWWNDNSCIFWQARNFSKKAKVKCFTSGNHSDMLLIYKSQEIK